MKRILVATDRSETAERAVAWAADLAGSFGAELFVLQVVLPAAAENGGPAPELEESLRERARELAGERGRAQVRVHADPPAAIVEAAEQEAADVLVVGNAGMAGRKEFLLGNVPNRISHNARCTVVIVNTTAGPAAQPAPAPEEHPEDEQELLGRAAQIARVAAKFGLEARQGNGSVEDSARRFRDSLEELGPTFAKLGQILSTRPGLLPPEFTDELATLQDKVSPLTEAEVVAVMEEELQVPWEDVFASIDAEPMAAGTIGQVHRATLEDGERVVVKVQRPNARPEILRDLGLLRLLAEKAAKRPALAELIDIQALTEHLTESLRRELDFRQEAESIERMRDVLRPYDRLQVPRLFGELSTARLLVMEEVQGVPIREAPDSEARPEAARQLLEAYYRQILTDGFFHADPHPGNLLWWNDRVYFIDFGMVGEIEPRLRELIVLLLLAFVRRDARFLAEVLLMLADDPATDVDMDALEREFQAFIERFGAAASLHEIELGAMIEEMAQIGARNRIRLPAALALSGKAFGQMQLAVGALDPTLDPFSVISGFLVRGLGERLREAADLQKLFYEGQKVKLRLTRLVEAIERTTGARPGARLQVDFIGTEAIRDAIKHTGRRFIVGGTIGAALAAGAVAWLAAHRPHRGYR